MTLDPAAADADACAPALRAVDTARVVSAVAGAHTRLCRAPQAVVALGAPDGRLMSLWGHDADEHTVFRIASMTKSFSAALVLALRDDGVLSLDAPVAAYAPELAGVVGPGADPAPITLRHLLSMASGLATDDAWADRCLDAGDAHLDAWLSGGLRFSLATGTGFEYSNLGYALVGRVVERVTGARLQDLVRTRLLAPLGLTHTAWSSGALPAGAVIAPGWHRNDDDLVPVAPLADGVLAPMGGLWSTAADLARWAAFLASAFSDGARVLHSDVLRAASRRELQHTHTATVGRTHLGIDGVERSGPHGYGLGLTTARHPRLGAMSGHSGGLPGYGSNMRWLHGGHVLVGLANITYAPMADTTLAVLDALAADASTGSALGAAPAGATLGATDSPVHAAAQRLVALLARWDDAVADALFAPNVAADRPYALRAIDAQRAGVRALLAVRAAGAASGSAVVATTAGTAELELELWPLAELRVQRYELQPHAG